MSLDKECLVYSILYLDVQPPTFVNCPGTLMFFPGNNKNEANVYWTRPAVTDNKDHSIKPRQVSGPSPFTFQEVNSYTVTYQAEDSTGNKAKQCTFSVIVKRKIAYFIILFFS